MRPSLWLRDRRRRGLYPGLTPSAAAIPPHHFSQFPFPNAGLLFAAASKQRRGGTEHAGLGDGSDGVDRRRGRTPVGVSGARGRGACSFGRERGQARRPGIYGGSRRPRRRGQPVAEAARGVDAVVHAASTTDQNRAAYDEAATRAIIDALRSTAKRFVYTSGCLLYGATGDTPATEDSPLHPIDLVRFRQAIEGEVLAAAVDGVHPIVIRPGWVYGNWGGTAMMMYGSAKEHGAARYVGDGKNRWTTVHADDLADLYLLALEKAPAASIFNGAHGAAIPLIEIARAASEGAGAKGRVTRMAPGRRTAGALGLRGRDRVRSGDLGRAGRSSSLGGARRGTRSSMNCCSLRPNGGLTPATGPQPQSPLAARQLSGGGVLAAMMLTAG